MKVKELIEKLEEFDGETEVSVFDREGLSCDIVKITIEKTPLNEKFVEIQIDA